MFKYFYPFIVGAAIGGIIFYGILPTLFPVAMKSLRMKSYEVIDKNNNLIDDRLERQIKDEEDSSDLLMIFSSISKMSRENNLVQIRSEMDFFLKICSKVHFPSKYPFIFYSPSAQSLITSWIKWLREFNVLDEDIKYLIKCVS